MGQPAERRGHRRGLDLELVGVHLGDVDVHADAGAFSVAVSCQRYSRSDTKHEMVTRPWADDELSRCGIG